jgi:hypothetical protein
MYKGFELYFTDLINKNQSSKFVILLGSGFHINHTSEDSFLNNWNLLLKSSSSNFESSGNYLLDFEKIILGQVSNSTAQNQENLLLKYISSKIKEAEKSALVNNAINYPSFIFNPEYVSDVISLNFDTVAENLCKILLNAKLKKKGYVKIDDKLGKYGLLHQTTKYKLFEFPDGKTLTFWYPHGSVLKSSGMILGARKYGQHINCVERLRKHSKAEARKNQKNDTWYDKLTHNPILILGASISRNEWDIWSSIVNRERNFFKKNNNCYRKPIFQMRSEHCKMECDDRINKKWFEPLFDETLSFKDQWNKLEKLFNT